MKLFIIFLSLVSIVLAYTDRGPYHFNTEEEEDDFDLLVLYLCRRSWSAPLVCHDPILNKDFDFTPWRSRFGLLYDNGVEFLEAAGHSQAEIDEAIKKAKANRIQPR